MAKNVEIAPWRTPNTQPQYTNRLPLVCQRVVKNITLAKRTFPTLFPRLSPSVIWTRHLLVFSTSAVSQEMEKTSEYYIWISFRISPEVWKSFRSANKPLILQIYHYDFSLSFEHSHVFWSGLIGWDPAVTISCFLARMQNCKPGRTHTTWVWNLPTIYSYAP